MAPGPHLEPAHLPPELHQHAPRQQATITEDNLLQGLEISVANYEKQLVTSALERAEGNVVKAALILKIPRGTLRYKMEKYGL
jgi:DNA-binding NtrC family response regulator